MIGRETVTIHPMSADKDRYGQQQSAGDDIEVTGCFAWPRGSSETGDVANTVVTGYSVVLPPGHPPLKPIDQLTYRGKRYEVEGEPGEYRMGGRPKGTIVALKRVTG